MWAQSGLSLLARGSLPIDPLTSQYGFIENARLGGRLEYTFAQSALRRVDKTNMGEARLVLAEGEAGVGVRAHCRRVAAWSCELARALGLSEAERKLVEQAALSHHVPEVLLDDPARRRLLADLRIEESGERSLLPDDVRQTLLVFWGRKEIPDTSIAKIVAALEIADDFDQYFEAQPIFEPDEPDQCANSSVQAMTSYLQVTSRSDVSRVIDRLPIFPRAARQVVKQVSNPEVSVHQLESIASLDPVLAGRLIQTVNSAFYSPSRPIGTVQHAIAYLGTELTRKILLAATIRGNFASMRLHQLWNHSLDVAQAAEQLARVCTTKIDPAEAFLAGLVHDIGRLAFAIMPAAFLERFSRLTEGGCPPIQVELCLSGRTHAEVGSDTLTQWKFPAAFVEAVRWHHAPERCASPLAGLLYLAECMSDSDEDLPSYARLLSACRQAGVDSNVLAEIGDQPRESLDALRFAA